MSYSKRPSTLIAPQFSLLWMVQQIQDVGLKIEWAHNAFDDIPTLKLYLATLACSEPGASSNQISSANQGDVQSNLPPDVLEELRKDVNAVRHDRLSGFSPWWMLEGVPSWKYSLDERRKQWKELGLVPRKTS